MFMPFENIIYFLNEDSYGVKIQIRHIEIL